MESTTRLRVEAGRWQRVARVDVRRQQRAVVRLTYEQAAAPPRQSSRAIAAAYMARYHPDWQEPTPIRPVPALPERMKVGQALVASMRPIATGYDPTREAP